MKLIVILGLIAAGLASADQVSSVTRLQAGKNPEGMGVNPVTHKAYIVAEDDAIGKAILVFDPASTSRPSKMIPIPNESEYVAIDSTRNRIYVATKYGLLDAEEGEDGEGEIELPDTQVWRMGALIVIDGNTDTVVASYEFASGIEPQGTAVDPVNNIVYVATKAPEIEPESGACPPGHLWIDGDGEEECWTAGTIYAFNAANVAAGPIKTIPAGDDPESIVFSNGMVYAANEDDGTITIARAVKQDGSGGELVTDLPRPLAQYSLRVFSYPNPLACIDNKFEADKMAAGGGSVFITDDRSRVAKITGAAVVDTREVPGATVCLEIPNTDGGGANSSNNIAFMQTSDRQFLFVVSEQNTVAVYDPATMELKSTITIPEARHLDAIGADGAANRVWITDEDLHAVFVLEGACANGTAPCIPPPSAPAIVSGNAATFTVGSPSTFTVAATGSPAPMLSEVGALPGGVNFTVNGNGTASLGGVPAPGTAGSYPVTITATNWVMPTAVQSFTLTVNSPQTAPSIASANTTTFMAGSAGFFLVRALGSPAPALSYTGALPGGVTFAPNGNGMATLAGVPADGSAGAYPLTITASNGVLPNATQNFILTVVAPRTAPSITSAGTATFNVGSLGRFTVTATGSPTPTLSYTGVLPAGVTFTPNGGGIATLAGAPAAGSAGSYPFTIMASNWVLPNAAQNFILIVTAPQAPAITSAAAATFTVGSAGSFTVTATGSPKATMSYTGTLPRGVIFTDTGNGAATLSGVAAAGAAGTYPITIVASNGVLPNATQNFTLTVRASQTAPAITSAGTTAFTVGSAGSFMVTATGSPTPALSYAGTLPGGVTFTPNSNGTATLAGVPAGGAAGSYPLTISASNGVLPGATQNFTLTVNPQPGSPGLAVLTTVLPAGAVNVEYSAQLEAAGGTPPYLWSAGVGFPGGLTLSSTGVILGKPAAVGIYTFTVQVTDSASHSAGRSLTVSIADRPPR